MNIKTDPRAELDDLTFKSLYDLMLSINYRMAEKYKRVDLHAVNTEGRELVGSELVECAQSIINTGMQELEKAPEVSQALLKSYLDGSDKNRQSLRDGELIFTKGEFVWTSEYRINKDSSGNSTVVFSLAKSPHIKDKESKEMEEKVKALLQLNQSGDIIFATSFYSHTFAPDSKEPNLDLFNRDLTVQNARIFFNTFRSSKDGS